MSLSLNINLLKSHFWKCSFSGEKFIFKPSNQSIFYQAIINTRIFYRNTKLFSKCFKTLIKKKKIYQSYNNFPELLSKIYFLEIIAHTPNALNVFLHGKSENHGYALRVNRNNILCIDQLTFFIYIKNTNSVRCTV